MNVIEVATGLEVPWDMVLGPAGCIWFTEAAGTVSRMDPDNGTVGPINTVSDVHLYGYTAGYFFTALTSAFFATLVLAGAGASAFFLATATTTASAIFFAVTALRFARVLLDFATVLPVPAAPFRNFDLLVVMCSVDIGTS